MTLSKAIVEATKVSIRRSNKIKAIGILILFLLGLAGIIANVLADEKVNVNTATLEQLQTVKGIGKVLSGRIVEGRPFTAIDSLINIKGIGVKTLAKMRPFIVVSDTLVISIPDSTTKK